MAATITVRRTADHRFADAGIGDIQAATAAGDLVWIDIAEPTAKALGKLVEQVPLPPLVVEDMIHPQIRPKIDEYPDLLFFIWIVPNPADEAHPVKTLTYAELCVVVRKGLVITTHQGPVKAIGDLLNGAISVSSPDAVWLVHAILDRSTDDLMTTIDTGATRLDELEDEVLQRAEQTQLEILYEVKRNLLELRKVVQGERDVVRELARSEEWVGREAYMYYQDVADHLARIADEVDIYFDVATGIMDIYLSAQNNRMNEIMKQLTVVATIFMPLTLLSGIYGMNLIRGMWPQPEQWWSFAAVVGSMLVIAAGMLWYFRRRKWW
jgi:magnesium transporter